MRASDFQIRNHDKLDQILTRLCELVVEGQRKNQDLGMVAAAVLDPDNNCVVGINYPAKDGHRVHAERAAIDSYYARFGKIPEGSIIITTCSPCVHDMSEREGVNCTDLIGKVGVHKVYAGYQDPSQDTKGKKFHTEITRNPKIKELCKKFASTFLDDEQLNELQFMGSQCTKDCSGHRAGYAWSKARGGVDANSPYSPSFNKGASLGKQELQRPQPQQQAKPPAQPQQAPNPLRPIKGPTI
jgi:pyrimidine deaminase RibD-like protein